MLLNRNGMSAVRRTATDGLQVQSTSSAAGATHIAWVFWLLSCIPLYQEDAAAPLRPVTWIWNLVIRRLGFPSAFPPPDARPRETGRNGWGREVTAEVVLPSLVLVTGDDRRQGGDRR
jgi:hypothetical protein